VPDHTPAETQKPEAEPAPPPPPPPPAVAKPAGARAASLTVGGL
jgi:hypothetical protein